MKLNFILEVALLFVTIIGIFKALEAQVAIRDATTSANQLKRSALDTQKKRKKVDEFTKTTLIELEKLSNKILGSTFLEYLTQIESIENYDIGEFTDEYRYRSLSPDNEIFITLKETANKAVEINSKKSKQNSFKGIASFSKLVATETTMEIIDDLVDKAKPNNTVLTIGSLSVIIGVIAMTCGLVLDKSLFVSFIIVPASFFGYFLLDRGISDISIKSNNIRSAVEEYNNQSEEANMRCRKLLNRASDLTKVLLKLNELLEKHNIDADRLSKDKGNDWNNYASYNKRNIYLKGVKIAYGLSYIIELTLIESDGSISKDIVETLEKITNLIEAVEKM